MFRYIFRSNFLSVRWISSRFISNELKISREAPDLMNSSNRPPTQLKKQIDMIQRKFPQHVLWIKTEQFYQIFDSGNYLEKVAALLNLRIETFKPKNTEKAEHRYARFPICRSKSCLHSLLGNGYTVAIVEQKLPDPITNYIKRRVTRIITPGTLLEGLELDNNFLLSVYLRTPKCRTVGLSWADVSTGEMYYKECKLADYANHLTRIQPKEVLIQKPLMDLDHPLYKLTKHVPAVVTPCDESFYGAERPPSFTGQRYTNYRLKSLNAVVKYSVIALLCYIRQSLKLIRPAFRRCTYHDPPHLEIDPKTFDALEITQTQREGSKTGSLLALIDQTKTPSGKRLLRKRIQAPSVISGQINYRLDLVEFFYNHDDARGRILPELSKIKDIERALQKVYLRIDGPAEISTILNSIDHCERVFAIVDELIQQTGSEVLERVMKPIKSLVFLVKEYENQFKSDQKLEAEKSGTLGTIQTGYNSMLDDHHRNPASLKSRVWTGLHGNYLSEKAISGERYLLEQVRESIKRRSAYITEHCQAIAEIDISVTFGEFAKKYGYIRPIMTTDVVHIVKNGRHPVFEQFQLENGNNFVVKDSNLNDKNRVWLLSGGNISGKSTFLRQTALISILAQAGLFVPCSEAKLGVFRQILSRISPSNELAVSQSTFMNEMNETSYILKNASKPYIVIKNESKSYILSLIIVDELGRGTSTNDGLSIALAIIKHIATESNSNSLCIFATQYQELSTLIEKHQIPNVKFHEAACNIDENKQLSSPSEIIPGTMNKSDGIRIAKLAGIPQSVIQDAKYFLKSIGS